MGVRMDLVQAKTRVAPLSGSTIAKMEIQELIQLTRLALKVVTASAMETKVDRLILREGWAGWNSWSRYLAPSTLQISTQEWASRHKI